MDGGPGEGGTRTTESSLVGPVATRKRVFRLRRRFYVGWELGRVLGGLWVDPCRSLGRDCEVWDDPVGVPGGEKGVGG